MSRTFTNLLSHVVFSTKDRQPLIVPEIKSELRAYLGGLTRELKGESLWHQWHERSRAYAYQSSRERFNFGSHALHQIQFVRLGSRQMAQSVCVATRLWRV